MDLALNNLQRLIYDKTQTTNQPIGPVVGEGSYPSAERQSVYDPSQLGWNVFECTNAFAFVFLSVMFSC